MIFLSTIQKIYRTYYSIAASEGEFYIAGFVSQIGTDPLTIKYCYTKCLNLQAFTLHITLTLLCSLLHCLTVSLPSSPCAPPLVLFPDPIPLYCTCSVAELGLETKYTSSELVISMHLCTTMHVELNINFSVHSSSTTTLVALFIITFTYLLTSQ